MIFESQDIYTMHIIDDDINIPYLVCCDKKSKYKTNARIPRTPTLTPTITEKSCIDLFSSIETSITKVSDI